MKDNKIPCSVVRDLLPLYADGLTSEETNEAVLAHVAGCPDCSRILESMKMPVSPVTETEKKEIDFLKKNRKRNRRVLAGSILAALLVAALILGIRTFVTGTELHGNLVASEVKVDGTHLTVAGAVLDSIHCISKVSFHENNGIVDIRAKAVFPGIFRDGSFRASYDASEPIRQVLLDGKIIWSDGTSIRPFAANLYATQHPYVGSMPNNQLTANALNISLILGEVVNELETSSEPYLWRIIVKKDLPQSYSAQIGEDLRSCGAALIGCIENLGQVEFRYTLGGKEQTVLVTEQDASRMLGSDIKACYGDPAATQDMVLALGLERFGYSWNPEPAVP